MKKTTLTLTWKSNLVGHWGWLIGPKSFRPKAYPACAMRIFSALRVYCLRLSLALLDRLARNDEYLRQMIWRSTRSTYNNDITGNLE